MKKIYRFLFVFSLFASCLILNSCSKNAKKDPTPEITAAVEKIDFKIGEQSSEWLGSAQIESNQVIIRGSLNSNSVTVVVRKSRAVGTYDIKGSQTSDAEVDYSPGASILYSSSFSSTGLSVGTVKITEIDEANKNISGTFSSTVLLRDGITSLSLATGSFNKIPFLLKVASMLTAKVNGNLFNADATTASSQSEAIGIHAQKDSNGITEVITIAVNNDITKGTYKIGDISSTINASYSNSSYPSIFESTEGTLTITSHDTSLKRIEGILNFKTSSVGDGTDGPTITEGAFAVSY